MICRIIACFLLLSSFSLTAQSVSPWTKTYTGTLLGLPAELSGTVENDFWTADINIRGYILQLKGRISGNESSGNMIDNATGTSTPYKATYAFNAITISIRDINPLTNQEEDMQFSFTEKVESENTGTWSTNTADNIDRAVVGKWRYTEAYVSGEFSFATDYFMQFDPNGTAYISEGRSAGGGPNSSIDSGAGDVHTGTWKTEGGILYLNDGTSGWVGYAKYIAEPLRMMLTFGDGKKQVWEKI